MLFLHVLWSIQYTWLVIELVFPCMFGQGLPSDYTLVQYLHALVPCLQYVAKDLNFLKLNHVIKIQTPSTLKLPCVSLSPK